VIRFQRLISSTAASFAIASFAVQAQDLKATWAPQVTDCSAFFGVWGQSDSSSADTYKSMSAAFATYAKQVHGPGESDAELMKSRRKMASMLHQARKGEAESKEAVAKQVTLCLSTLKNAEQDLWPRLSAAQKQETPKLSK
jgi:predicted transcriptional regulator